MGKIFLILGALGVGIVAVRRRIVPTADLSENADPLDDTMQETIDQSGGGGDDQGDLEFHFALEEGLATGQADMGTSGYGAMLQRGDSSQPTRVSSQSADSGGSHGTTIASYGVGGVRTLSGSTRTGSGGSRTGGWFSGYGGGGTVRTR